MLTIIKQRDKYLKLFSFTSAVCLIVLLGFIVPKSALSEKTISATKSLGITSSSISITLSNKTVLKLNVLPETLENDVYITLFEPDEIPYREDIIGIFSVKIENNNNLRLKKPINIKVFPENRIDPEREKMVQVYKLKKQDKDRKYWSRVFGFSIDNAEGSMNVLIKEPGVYKIEYSKLRVGSIDKTNGAFFKLNSPNGYGKPANFSLKFDNTGYVFFLIEDEDGNNIWDGYSALSYVRSDWNTFVIDNEHFTNDSIGKYKVSCYYQLDIVHLNELWTTWFIRDHENIGDEVTIKELLDKYAPYVYFGDYRESKDYDKDPWGYDEGELSNGEIYYPIDIRELVTTYAPDLTTDGVSDYHVTVGTKWDDTFKTRGNFCISNAQTIKTNNSEGIDIASYNDGSLEYGITRNWSYASSQYELLEFEGSDDATPYISEINSNKFGSLSSDSKIYGTAYEKNGYVFLQYFFYYPFDPKNGKTWLSELISRHAGDRERFVIILKKAANLEESQPVGACFFHHYDNQIFSYYGDDLKDDKKKFSWNDEKESPGAYVKWIKVNKTGNHPHIYIAQGSHGIYFRQGSYTVDVPYTTLSKDLKEYAGGQSEKTYSTEDGNLIYLPRLSEIDTEKNNTKFSFLLFSGAVAQTSGLLDTKIYFPPYDDVWYAVDRYCLGDNGKLDPKNDISDKLADVEDSIAHTLTAPSKTTVSQGGSLGPFTVKERNNSSSYYAYYVQPYVKKPDGTTLNFKKISTGLGAGEERTFKGYLYIPASSELGTFTFGVKITDTSGNLIDNDSFEFTVVSGTSYAMRRSARKLKRLMRNPEAQVVEEDGWKVVIVPENNR